MSDGRYGYLEHVLAKGLKEETIQRFNIYLDQFYKWLNTQAIEDIREVTPNIIWGYQVYVSNYKTRWGKPQKIATNFSKLSVIKSYFGYLVRHRHILLDPTLNMEMPKLGLQIPKNILTQAEAEQLLKLPKDTLLGIRDRAILEVLYSTGMRGKELRNLELYDVNLRENQVHIKNPKNKRDRIVPLGRTAVKAIEEYLSKSRPKMVRVKYANETALFLSQYGKRMAKESVPYILSVYSKRMNIEKRITPHCLRHSFATHLLENGADVAIIQHLLGHTTIKTTEIYTRVTQPELKKAVQAHHPRGSIKKLHP